MKSTRQKTLQVADMKNSGGRYGGAITAGLFLKQFIEEVRERERERSFFPSPPLFLAVAGAVFLLPFFFLISRFFSSPLETPIHPQGVEWAHIDIAGPAWSDGEGGATGFGVATLAQWASEAGARVGASGE